MLLFVVVAVVARLFNVLFLLLSIFTQAKPSLTARQCRPSARLVESASSIGSVPLRMESQCATTSSHRSSKSQVSYFKIATVKASVYLNINKFASVMVLLLNNMQMASMAGNRSTESGVSTTIALL